MRWCWSWVLALLTAASAHAQPPEAGAVECRVPAPDGHPLANRRGNIAAMERLPRSCLETLVLECNRGAEESLLDAGSAAVCSMGYEVLLRKSFGGSFDAMLAWWQRDRDARRVP